MYNRIQLIGRLAKNPEKKNLSTFDLAQFTLVQNRKSKEQDIAQYYDCKAWGKTCEKIMNFKKGDLVLIEGRLDQETWSKPDGTKGSKHIVNVMSCMLIPKLDKVDTSEGIYPHVEVEYSGAGEDIF